MNKVNPKKLLNSKWTAQTPQNKEKHFIVTNIWSGRLTVRVSRKTGFYAAARQPHAEAAGVVIPTVVLGFQGALRVDGAAEFSAPNDEGVIQHAAAFEVGD